MEHTTRNLSKKFHETNEIGSNGIHWIMTYDIAIIDDKKLWKLFKLAMPYQVILDQSYYQRYEKIYKWLNKNSTGLWTHTQLCFLFENGEDALAFKLWWG